MLIRAMREAPRPFKVTGHEETIGVPTMELNVYVCNYVFVGSAAPFDRRVWLPPPPISANRVLAPLSAHFIPVFEWARPQPSLVFHLELVWTSAAGARPLKSQTRGRKRKKEEYQLSMSVYMNVSMKKDRVGSKVCKNYCYRFVLKLCPRWKSKCKTMIVYLRADVSVNMGAHTFLYAYQHKLCRERAQ